MSFFYFISSHIAFKSFIVWLFAKAVTHFIFCLIHPDRFICFSFPSSSGPSLARFGQLTGTHLLDPTRSQASFVLFCFFLLPSLSGLFSGKWEDMTWSSIALWYDSLHLTFLFIFLQTPFMVDLLGLMSFPTFYGRSSFYGRLEEENYKRNCLKKSLDL